jgi:transposase-like protein
MSGAEPPAVCAFHEGGGADARPEPGGVGGIVALIGSVACQLLCILGCLLTSAALPPAAVLFNLLFWSALVVQARDAGLSRRDVITFLPLAAIFYTLFLFHREAPETMDYLFGSDTRRYLDEAMRFFVSPRHIGMSIFTFPLPALAWFGGLIGWGRLGHEALHAQAALTGALAAALLSRTLQEEGTSRLIGALCGYGFAFSLAPLTFSATIESFVPSTLVLILCLRSAVRLYERGGTRETAELSLLLALGLLLSLENLLLAVALLVPFALGAIRSPRRLILRTVAGAAASTAILVLVLVVFVPVARFASGPGFYQDDWSLGPGATATGFVDYSVRFGERYTAPLRLMIPAAWASGAFRAFVMSVVAQPARTAMYYMWDLDGIEPFSAANLIFYALAALVGGLAAPGLVGRVRRGHDSRFIVLFLSAAAVVLLRQPFLICYAWRASILFSAPSILALWLLVGLGLAERKDTGGQRRVGAAALALAALVCHLAAVNGSYLLEVQRLAGANPAHPPGQRSSEVSHGKIVEREAALSQEDGVMGKPRRYSREVRERAVRMVQDHQAEHASQWAAIGSIASKIGCTAETLRKWVRQAERDQRLRAGLTTEELAEPRGSRTGAIALWWPGSERRAQGVSGMISAISARMMASSLFSIW